MQHLVNFSYTFILSLTQQNFIITFISISQFLSNASLIREIPIIISSAFSLLLIIVVFVFSILSSKIMDFLVLLFFLLEKKSWTVSSVINSIIFYNDNLQIFHLHKWYNNNSYLNSFGQNMKKPYLLINSE